jgi:hypothetical protein
MMAIQLINLVDGWGLPGNILMWSKIVIKVKGKLFKG